MTDNLLKMFEQEAKQDIHRANSLPFAVYSDSGIYKLETNNIFHNDWVFVCAKQQLATPGDYYSLDLCGEQVVIIHGKDDEYRALSNICRHRGTPLLDTGFGSLDKHIVCPYHAWTYSDRGELKAVPFAGEIEVDKQKHCLKQFHLQNWKGLLFIHLGSNPEPLTERFYGLDNYIDIFNIEKFSMVQSSESEYWESNWKLAVENGIESYHLFKVHKETLETITPTKQTYYVAGSSEWAVTGGQMKDTRSTLSKWFSGHHPEAYNHYLLVFLPPSFIGIITYDSFYWIQVLPNGSEKCIINSAGISNHQSSKEDSEESMFAAAFLAEDKWICERLQKGMNASKAQGGKLVSLEKILIDFRQYLGSRLFDFRPLPFSESKQASLFKLSE